MDCAFSVAETLNRSTSLVISQMVPLRDTFSLGYVVSQLSRFDVILISYEFAFMEKIGLNSKSYLRAPNSRCLCLGVTVYMYYIIETK